MSGRSTGSRPERSRCLGAKDFAKPETVEVANRIRALAEQQKARQFVPDREKDCLSVSIGTKEHVEDE